MSLPGTNVALPVEFTIGGPPLSHQTADRRRLAAWREAVRVAARLHLPLGAIPSASQLRLLVVYYHEENYYNIDNDNLVKPIQDAL